MFFGPVYPWLVVAATKVDPRFAKATDCIVEAINAKRHGTDCEAYARPIHIIHAALLTLGVLAIVRLAARRYAYLAAFFAGFCLIANGAYLAAGSLLANGADDGGTILRHGGAAWQLVAFGVLTVPAGLYLCNGLGHSFGLGVAQGKVDRKAAVGAALALLLLVLGEVILGG